MGTKIKYVVEHMESILLPFSEDGIQRHILATVRLMKGRLCELGLFWQGPGIFGRKGCSDMFCQLYNMHNIRHAEETESAVQSVALSLPAELLNFMQTDDTQQRKHVFPRRDGFLFEEGGNMDCQFKWVEEGPRFQRV
jgi:hypothetical protein